jgi:hypothetical protein
MLYRFKKRLWKIKFKIRALFSCLKHKTSKFSKNPSIYHIHIRKTAGTSVNAAFWKLADYDFSSAGKESLLMKSDFIAVRHHFDLINRGCYHYANSHAPIWKLELKPDTFTFTVLREPLKRLISLYKYYYWHEHEREWASTDPQHKNVLNYTHWLGNNFEDFLNNLPRMHRENQLYMFSGNFDVDEALKNLSTVSAVYHQQDLQQLEVDVANRFNLEIKIGKERSYSYDLPREISEKEISLAKSLLKDEYKFYNKVIEQRNIS